MPPPPKLDGKDQGLETVDEDLLTPSLVRIDLSKNRIHNPLPGVAHLVELRWLNLSKNKLTVCIDWSGGIPLLLSLSLTRVLPQALDGIANLPSLQVLNVSHNNLSGKLSLGKLRDLNTFVGNGNGLTSLGTYLSLPLPLPLPIPPPCSRSSRSRTRGSAGGLEKLTKLETLILSNNAITELSGWISSATALTKLSASNNPVENFAGLADLKNMKELRLNSTGMRRVGEVVGGMSRLRILEVGGSNGIERWDDVGTLPKGLWQLNLKGTPLSSTPGYADRVVELFDQLDMIDGRRRREKNKSMKVKADGRGGAGGGDRGDGQRIRSADRGAAGGVRGTDQRSGAARGAPQSVVERLGSSSAEQHRREDGKGVDDVVDDHSDDDALDPDEFKADRKRDKRDKREKRVVEKKPPKKKTKTKKKKMGNVAAVLHADKADALSTW